jgi:hypothetical protein
MIRPVDTKEIFGRARGESSGTFAPVRSKCVGEMQTSLDFVM